MFRGLSRPPTTAVRVAALALVLASMYGTACARHGSRSFRAATAGPRRQPNVPSSEGDAAAAERRADETLGRVRKQLSDAAAAGGKAARSDTSEMKTAPLVGTTGTQEKPTSTAVSSSVVTTPSAVTGPQQRALNGARNEQGSAARNAPGTAGPLFFVVIVRLGALVWFAWRAMVRRRAPG